jgi:hypothetical protein
MAKHKKYSRKKRGQKRNKTSSKKIRGGFDHQYESPPPVLNINELNDSQETDSQETISYNPDDNDSQGFSQDISQGFSQDSSQGPLTLSQLGNEKRAYEETSFESQEPYETKRTKIDPKFEYESEEEKSDDEEYAYQSDNQYDPDDDFNLNGGRKRKRKRTNKRRTKKLMKTRKNKKRRQRGGIIL